MATLNLGTAGSYTWFLDYTLTQSVVNNQSTIAYTLRIHKNAGSGAFWGTPARTFTVTVAGTADAEGFSSVDFTGVSDINFNTGSKVITHNADGTHAAASIAASVSGSYVSASFPVPTSFSGKTIALPTIPRAATSITRSSGTETGSATVLAISPLVSSFYYILKYQSPATGAWTLIGSGSGIAGSSWPYSTTIAHGEIPNATSGIIQYQVTTLDSSGGTQIGSPVESSFSYTVPTSVVPTAGAPSWAEGATTTGLSTLTNSGAVFAQGWSKLKPTFSATPGSGATVSSATATVNGVSGSTTSGVAFGNVVTSQGSGSTFDVAVTDSRGRTDHDTGTVSPAVHRWTLPTANAGSVVVTPTSTTQTIALSGYSATTTSFYLSGAQRNVIHKRTGYRDLTTGGAWSYQPWTIETVSSSDSTDNAYAPGTPLTAGVGLDPTHEYEISFQVRDIFGFNGVNYSTGLPYVSSSLIVPAQNVLVAFDGNTRVGIGKIPTQGSLDVLGQIYQNNGKAVLDTDYVPDTATTSVKGISELATSAETITGTDATRVVTPQGLTAAINDASNGYRLKQVVQFTSSGTFSKASYPGLRAIRVKVQAGGGSGGGAPAVSGGNHADGAGGGGGGYAEIFALAASVSSSIAVTIGAGGTGGTGNGGDGGTSSFGSLASATGGGGGVAGVNSALAIGPGGGDGGIGTVGDILLAGQAGFTPAGYATLPRSGAGGSSQLGGGGKGTYTGSTGGRVVGNPGGNYGAGGSGAAAAQSAASATAGGDGAPGIVIVEVYV